MRRSLWLLSAGATALMLAACAPSTSSPPAPTATQTPPTETALPTATPPEATDTPAPDPTEMPTEVPTTAPPNEQVFAIVGAESEVRFVVGEILNGNPNTVVGATNGVSGEIVADYANTTTAQVRTLIVDLSGLRTDNGFRNRAIHDFILQTGNPAYRTATFVQTAISGLPPSVEVGQRYAFQITGNLAIHGVTQEVTFEAAVTPVSATRLEGTAFTTVRYADFGVSILRLPPQVASVEEEVRLEIDFVAVAGS